LFVRVSHESKSLTRVSSPSPSPSPTPSLEFRTLAITSQSPSRGGFGDFDSRVAHSQVRLIVRDLSQMTRVNFASTRVGRATFLHEILHYKCRRPRCLGPISPSYNF